MGKTHFAWCDRAHEGDNMDYWSEKTACGLYVDNDNYKVADQIEFVSCKHCLRIMKSETKTTEEGKGGEGC